MDKRKIKELETVRIYKIYKAGRFVREELDFNVRRTLKALECYDKELDKKFRAKRPTTQEAIFEAQHGV